MIVIDASTAVKLVTEEPLTDVAVARVMGDDERIAPDWIKVEVANAIARKVRHVGLPADAAMQAVAEFPAFLTDMRPASDLLEKAFSLGLALEQSVYDCLYLALAIEHHAVVVTADAKFAHAAERGGYAANIELLA